MSFNTFSLCILSFFSYPSLSHSYVSLLMLSSLHVPYFLPIIICSYRFSFYLPLLLSSRIFSCFGLHSTTFFFFLFFTFFFIGLSSFLSLPSGFIQIFYFHPPLRFCSFLFSSPIPPLCLLPFPFYRPAISAGAPSIDHPSFFPSRAISSTNNLAKSNVRYKAFRAASRKKQRAAAVIVCLH